MSDRDKGYDGVCVWRRRCRGNVRGNVDVDKGWVGMRLFLKIESNDSLKSSARKIGQRRQKATRNTGRVKGSVVGIELERVLQSLGLGQAKDISKLWLEDANRYQRRTTTEVERSICIS